MARKSKRKRNSRPAGFDLFERAQRELGKGNAKAALKDATQCYRVDASPAHRRLLEEAYVGRVQELHQMKLTAEARSVLARLIDLDPTTAEVREKIPQLQVVIGDASVDADAVFEDNPVLLVEQADRAVLDSREAVPDFAGTKAHVECVREALAAVERGDDETASDLLAGVPRRSPLCDWKLFVRGLLAFYGSDRSGSDGERTRENWRRLDRKRPAFRIAKTLLVGAGESLDGFEPVEGEPVDVSGSVRRLRTHVESDPTADTLKRIAENWREGNLSAFFRLYRQLRQRFAKTHGELLIKIVEIVWKRAVREDERYLLDRLAEVGPAPDADPNWNRARALLAEHPNQKRCELVETCWTAYAEEVAALPSLREDERSIASGLVYAHLARCFVEYGAAAEKPTMFSAPDEEEANQFRSDAVRFYEESIARCPRLTYAYTELAALHELAEEPHWSAAVLRRLVRQDEDQFEAQVWLANYYLGQDEPGDSAPYADATVRLRPRDPQTIWLRWNQRVTMVRRLAKNRQFEAARQELEEAAKFPPSGIESFVVDTLRAGIEFRAKNAETAKQYVDAAVRHVQEPTAVWMHMSCIAARFGLPPDTKKEFEGYLKDAIKKRTTSQTAGLLARFHIVLKARQINYTGRATQERLVIGYIKRTKRVRWLEEDLQSVCEFLRLLPKQVALQKTMVEIGFKKFPNNPTFQFMTGQQEMEQGPLLCDEAKATRCFQSVLDLIPQPSTPADLEMVESAQKSLSVLQYAAEQAASRFGSPFWDNEEDEKEDGYFDPSIDEEDECDCEDCKRRRERFASPGGVDVGTVLDELKRVMPRPIAKQFERLASEAGVSVDELLMEMIKRGPPGMPMEPDDPQGDTRRRGKKKRSKATR